MGMKENIVYNQYDNAVYVKTDGDKISIICNEESLDALDVSILLIFSCNHSFHVE